MNNLKLGIAGGGFVAKFHAQALRQVRDIEIAGVTALQGAEKFSAFARENGLGSATVYPNVSEMAKKVDAVAIFVPNLARVAVMEEIVDAVKSGAELKGVICEKPLARNVAEAQKMVNLAQEANLKTAYFENQIFMKPIQVQREQLIPQQRSMGPLTLVRSAEEHGGPHMPWFWDPLKQGGGVLSDMGCHSIAVGWYLLTPVDKPLDFLIPQKVMAETKLLKWGLPVWRKKLLEETGVDYSQTPAEDFTTGTITFRNPETTQEIVAQFTDSWMFEKQGLRLLLDGMGPGYAFEINSLISPLTVFISDLAAEAVADKETALEKATASRGLLAVQPNEADLYGYTDENEEMAKAFRERKNGYLSWNYGLEIVKLVMAAYMSAEKQKTIDLTDANIQKELESFIPLIQQGKGREVLHLVK